MLLWCLLCVWGVRCITGRYHLTLAETLFMVSFMYTVAPYSSVEYWGFTARTLLLECVACDRSADPVPLVFHSIVMYKWMRCACYSWEPTHRDSHWWGQTEGVSSVQECVFSHSYKVSLLSLHPQLLLVLPISHSSNTFHLCLFLLHNSSRACFSLCTERLLTKSSRSVPPA